MRITQETPVSTKETEKNKESQSTISDIEDYVNKKYDELAISSLKRELLQEVHLLFQRETNNIISILQIKMIIFQRRLVNFLRKELKEENIVIENLWITVNKISTVISVTIRIPLIMMISP